MRLFKKILRVLIDLTRNGIIHSFRLFYICLILPFIIKVLSIYLRFYPRVKRIIDKYFCVDKEMQYWQQNKEELLKLGKNGYKIKIEILRLNQEKLELLKEIQQQSNEVVIAEIDQDGFLLSHFGAIRNAPTISEKQFLVRKRFNLKLVDINGYIGVKKDYKGNKVSFLYEIKTLHILGSVGCNVPSIMDIDFDNLTLTFSYICGSILREELAKSGAVLRDRDVDNNPYFVRFGRKERIFKRIQEGKRVLYDVIDSKFVEELFTELNKIHESGLILNDIKYGNIIIEKKSGKPYFIDFDYSGFYSNLGKISFRILRDQNIEKFNLLFDTEKLTRKRIKEKRIKVNDVYAPVYFGFGLRVGRIWNVNVGYGRWHYILKHNLPSLSGKRILDLGANNAFNSIQMLRNGAREVIGIELDSKYIEQGNFVKAGFEWADNTQYNFRYIQANLKEISAMNLGKFDMVLSLCSYYYLDDDSIINLVQYISTTTDIFVLQCNIDKNMSRSDPNVYNKASTEYALKILKENGFPITQVISPYRYTRPLVIGRKEK